MACEKNRAKKAKLRGERVSRELVLRMSFEERDEYDRRVEEAFRDQHVLETRTWQDAHDDYR